MNRQSDPTGQPTPQAESADAPKMFVTNDFRSMPASEIRHIVDGVGTWLAAVTTHKLLRSIVRPEYVIEMRRLIKAKHVPKRMQKHFDDLRRQWESLNFSVNFHATVPALGPYSSTTMVMSRRDGDLHFFATRITTRVAGKVRDEGYIELRSWCTDGTSLVTMSAARLPRPPEGVDRLMINSEDPALLLKKHRERLRKKEFRAIAPADLFAQVESDHQKQTEDLLRRGVIRLATAAEVTRIRAEM